jgi:hypothetical protein
MLNLEVLWHVHNMAEGHLSVTGSQDKSGLLNWQDVPMKFWSATHTT